MAVYFWTMVSLVLWCSSSSPYDRVGIMLGAIIVGVLLSALWIIYGVAWWLVHSS